APVTQRATEISEDVRAITASVRSDVASVHDTVASANGRVRDAVSLTEQRLRDFDAFLHVVQDEAERLFLSTAATFHGVREGTAALIGATIGAGVTYMLRRGPSGRRPVSPVVRGLGAGAMWAGRRAATLGARGSHWVADQGEALWETVPRKAIRREMEHYVSH